MNYRATTSSETDLNTALTKIGTGKGPLNGGLEALAKGLLHSTANLGEAPQTITLILLGSLGRTSPTGRRVYGLLLQSQCLDRRLISVWSSRLD